MEVINTEKVFQNIADKMEDTTIEEVRAVVKFNYNQIAAMMENDRDEVFLNPFFGKFMKGRGKKIENFLPKK